MRLTYVAGARDDLRRAEFEPAAVAERNSRLRRLMAGDARRPLPAEPAAAVAPDDLVASLLSALAAAGFTEVVAVDLARTEIGIAVVRVVVPGLLTERGEGGVPGVARGRAP